MAATFYYYKKIVCEHQYLEKLEKTKNKTQRKNLI